MPPTNPGASALQPPDDDPLLRDLAVVEDPSAALQLERIADQEIVLTLQLTGFDPASPEWQTLARALAEYGYSVFTGWGLTGALRRMAAKHGRSGVAGLAKIPEGLRLERDDALTLAADVTTVSVEAFRTKTLMDPRRTWSPTGGASLKTYFIGRALMELPDVYQRWERGGRDVIDLRGQVDDGRHSDDPAHHAVASATLTEIAGTDPDTVAMFELQQQGYEIAEIAELLSTTPGRYAAE